MGTLRQDTSWMNRVAFDPKHDHSHVESLFIKANDPATRRALWLKLTLFASRKERYAETWAILFDGEHGRHRGAKQRYPMERVHLDPERPGLEVGDCCIRHCRSAGAVEGPGIGIGWRLTFEDELPGYQHFPSRRMYETGLVSSKICTPHPSVRLTGEVEIWGGERSRAHAEMMAVNGWRGMQGHNWGRRHAERYAWCHCNLFDEAGPQSFFEAFAAQMRVAGMLAPPLSLGRLVLEGHPYRFDTWRNLKPVETQFGPTRWELALAGPDGELEGAIVSKPADTVGLHYPNPNGDMSYCLNSKLSRLELELQPREGPARSLTSDCAALEVTQLDPYHGIDMLL